MGQRHVDHPSMQAVSHAGKTINNHPQLRHEHFARVERQTRSRDGRTGQRSVLHGIMHTEKHRLDFLLTH